MKSSIYNLFYEIDNQVLLFNSMTTGCIMLSLSMSEYLKCNRIELIEIENPELYAVLRTRGFIIDDNIDEYTILRHIYNTTKYATNTYTLTIAPTMSCNLSCTYCFEKTARAENELRIMPKLVMDKLIGFVASKIKEIKHLNIIWFGGEPLLAIKEIDYLSGRFRELAKSNNVTYHAVITTNGTLFTRNPCMIDDLVRCEIKNVQLTLDGSPEEHNARRKYRNGYTGTFDDIINAACLLRKHNIDFSIRINLDNGNIGTLEKLLMILKEYDLDKENISFGHLRDFDSLCAPVYPYMTSEEFYEAFISSSEMIESVRKRNNVIQYPVIAKPCVANRQNTLIVDHVGNMYKCRSAIGNSNPTIGNIFSFDKLTINECGENAKWVDWSPFDYGQCRDCTYLPICLGGCAYCAMIIGKPECCGWKSYLDRCLKKVVSKKRYK